MSLYDYNQSLEMKDKDFSFSALIMAAIRKADSFNTEKLKNCWPELWDEMFKRYNAPGGVLVGEEE